MSIFYVALDQTEKDDEDRGVERDNLAKDEVDNNREAVSVEDFGDQDNLCQERIE